MRSISQQARSAHVAPEAFRLLFLDIAQNLVVLLAERIVVVLLELGPLALLVLLLCSHKHDRVKSQVVNNKIDTALNMAAIEPFEIQTKTYSFLLRAH